MQGQFDIAILGKDAAGLAAACHLATAGRKVAVIGGPERLVESPLCDWSPFDLAELPELSKAVLMKAGAAQLGEIRYHDNSKETHVIQKLGRSSVWVFPSGGLAGQLEKQAKKAGVRFFKSIGASDFAVADDAVVLGLSKPVRASCLIITGGLPADYADRLAVSCGSPSGGGMSVAGIDMDLGSPAPFTSFRWPITGSLESCSPSAEFCTFGR